MSAKSTSLDAHFLDVTVSPTETEFAHDLGRTPVEGFVLRINSGNVVFRGPSAWTKDSIFLRGSAQALVRILIF